MRNRTRFGGPAQPSSSGDATRTRKLKGETTNRRKRPPGAQRMRVWVVPGTPVYDHVMAMLSQDSGLPLMARLMREPATIGVEIIWHAAREADVVGAVSEFDITLVDDE